VGTNYQGLTFSDKIQSRFDANPKMGTFLFWRDSENGDVSILRGGSRAMSHRNSAQAIEEEKWGRFYFWCLLLHRNVKIETSLFFLLVR
jgi:hypothetical protein